LSVSICNNPQYVLNEMATCDEPVPTGDGDKSDGDAKMIDSVADREEPLDEAQAAVMRDCPYCPHDEMTTFKFERAGLPKLYINYHEPCANARCSRPDATHTALCDPCRHLRLWHHIHCMENHSRALPYRMSSIVSSNASCPFCRMVNGMVEYEGKVTEMADTEF
jgi:hypothetical protein